jgi:hypothetical protein
VLKGRELLGLIALLVAVFALGAYIVYQFTRPTGIAEPSRTVQALLPTTAKYLEKKAGGGDRTTADGWTWFCSVRYLGNTSVDERFELYVWEGCQEYRPYRQGLAELTGWSVPAVITIARRGGSYRPIAERQPGDGTDYGPNIRRMFPSAARVAIRSIPEGTGQGSAVAMFKALKARARRELT